MITTGLAHLDTGLQAQQRESHAKEEAGGPTPGTHAPRAWPRPALHRLGPSSLTDSIYYQEDGAGVGLANLDPEEPAQAHI
jgi:hypothetical protein